MLHDEQFRILGCAGGIVSLCSTITCAPFPPSPLQTDKNFLLGLFLLKDNTFSKHFFKSSTGAIRTKIGPSPVIAYSKGIGPSCHGVPEATFHYFSSEIN